MNDKVSLGRKLWARLFPRIPDFYGLLDEQCDLLVEALQSMLEFMETGDSDKAHEVRRLEKVGDQLKAHNIDALNRSFSTPFDREDIYMAVVRIDHVLNYAKTTMREMELLEITADRFTLEMTGQLKAGAVALRSGFGHLRNQPLAGESDARAARKTERRVEKIYRAALAEMFQGERYRTLMRKETTPDVHECLAFVVSSMKRREVYRHLSNASDRLAHAADLLHDIIVKNM
jgi:hypothetical protein